MTSRRRTLASAVGAVLAAAVLLLAPLPAASAHDALATATPAADETITTALTQVQLTFNEAPLAGFDSGIAIAVLDPSGADVSSGDIGITDTTLTKAIAPTTAGTYQVLWQTVSADGHPISGQYAFTYAVEPTPTPTPTPTPSAVAESPTPSSPTTSPQPTSNTPSSMPTATAASGDIYSTLFPIGLVAGIVVVIAVVAIAIIVSIRRRRRDGQDA
jgi:methionine-rich copper-binding protein CopC